MWPLRSPSSGKTLKVLQFQEEEIESPVDEGLLTPARQSPKAVDHFAGQDSFEANYARSVTLSGCQVEELGDYTSAAIPESQLASVSYKMLQSFRRPSMKERIAPGLTAAPTFGLSRISLKFDSLNSLSGEESEEAKDAPKDVKQELFQAWYMRGKKREPFLEWDEEGSWMPTINHKSDIMTMWDLLITLLLITTALLTPYEVAFSADEVMMDAVFILNLFIDSCFFVDMLFQFILPFMDHLGRPVRYHTIIARRYLQGWFLIDLLSILPFNLLSYLLKSEELQSMKVMRIVRLLRLAKLLRVVRGMRMFKRWEARLFVNYAMLNLTFLCTSLIVGAHWLACAWGFIVEVDDEASWEKTFPIWVAENSSGLDSLHDKYMACMYFSVGLFTAMGDAMAANIHTRVGQSAYIVVMCVAGVANAYLIGGVVSLIDRMNKQKSDFYRDMDILNEFLYTKQIPEGQAVMDGRVVSGQELCEKLRTYYIFKHSQGHLADSFRDILFSCSQQMQGGIAAKLYAEELRSIPVFRDVSSEFVAFVAVRITTEIYASHEKIYDVRDITDRIFIVERGVVFVAGKMLREHDTFGGEVLHSAGQPRGHLAMTIHESVVLSVTGDILREAAVKHGDALMRMRMKMLGALLKAAEHTKKAARMAINQRNFHRGYRYMRSQFSDTVLEVPNSPLVHMLQFFISKYIQATYGVLAIDSCFRPSKPLDPHWVVVDVGLQKRAMEKYFNYINSRIAKRQERERMAKQVSIEEFMHNPANFGGKNMSKYYDQMSRKHQVKLDTLMENAADAGILRCQLMLMDIPYGDASRIASAVTAKFAHRLPPSTSIPTPHGLRTPRAESSKDLPEPTANPFSSSRSGSLAKGLLTHPIVDSAPQRGMDTPAGERSGDGIGQVDPELAEFLSEPTNFEDEQSMEQYVELLGMDHQMSMRQLQMVEVGMLVSVGVRLGHAMKIVGACASERAHRQKFMYAMRTTDSAF